MKIDKIFIAGHQGMVGSALCQEFLSQGYRNLVTCPKSELDLSDQNSVLNFLENLQPDGVIIAAGKNGKLEAYDALRADFMYQNLMIQTNLIHGAWRAGVKRVFLVAGDYVYPNNVLQPIPEEVLLTGQLYEPSEAYALAKIAGIKMIESYNRQYGTSYMSLISSHLYGPQKVKQTQQISIVIQLLKQVHLAKIRKQKTLQIHNASQVYELLYVNDFAKACVHLYEHPMQQSFVNVGFGEGLSVRDLVHLIVEMVGYHGEIEFLQEEQINLSRCLNMEKLNQHGWKPSIQLKQGLKLVYGTCLELGVLESDVLEPMF